MSKRTVFTSITPLPAGISRQAALEFLHDHAGMIDLSPLVVKRYPISPPKHALPEEHACKWYAIIDRISYLPGLVSNDVEFTAAFHDLPMGLQTHCYAPMGLDLREKWTVGGYLPGETPEPVELGLEVPPTGLYIREDVDMRCSIVMAAFVKRTLKKAHETAVESLITKATIRARVRDAMHKQKEVDDTSFPQHPLFAQALQQSSSSQPSSSSSSSDKPSAWGGRQTLGESSRASYNRQVQERIALLSNESRFAAPLAKELYY